MKHFTIPAMCLRKARNVGMCEAFVQLLYNLLLIPSIRTYLEIGCGQGVSTSAARQALEERGSGDFHPCVCDVVFTPPVLKLTGSGFERYRMKSVKLLAESYPGRWDCIFVDGEHKEWTNGQEIEQLHRLGVDTVICHDTAHPRIPSPARFVTAFPEYTSIHDGRWFGLFIASRDPEVASEAQAIYGEFLAEYPVGEVVLHG